MNFRKAKLALLSTTIGGANPVIAAKSGDGSALIGSKIVAYDLRKEEMQWHAGLCDFRSHSSRGCSICAM